MRPQNIAFSTVSIRPSAPNGPLRYQLTSDGIIESGNSLLYLLTVAFNLPEYKFVIGAPAWLGERYDIIAKVDEEDRDAFASKKPVEKEELLQKVFTERFGMTYHTETREFPSYILIQEKGGIRARNLRPTSQVTASAQWKLTGHYQLSAKSMTMADLCSVVLTTEAQGLVVDQTGLTGKFDIDLRWSRDTSDMEPGAESLDAPGIFTAVKEELGLQLVPKKMPVKVLVIDHIERPQPN